VIIREKANVFTLSIKVSQEKENQVNNGVLKHLKEHLTLLLHEP